MIIRPRYAGNSSRLLAGRGLGTAQIDFRHPLTQGLSYFRLMDRDIGRPLFIAGGTDGNLILNNASLMPLPGGYGLTGSGNNAMTATTAPSYNVPQSAGTLLSYVVAGFAANDSVAHYISIIGNVVYPTGPTIDFVKFSDNNWYFGWYNGSDTRASGAATGTFNAGDAFLAGGTWNSSGTKLYIKGAQIAANATAPSTGITSTNTLFYIGAEQSGTSPTTPWSTVAGRDGIIWYAIWNRTLSAAEINFLNWNPFAFLKFPIDSFFASPRQIAGSLARGKTTSYGRAIPNLIIAPTARGTSISEGHAQSAAAIILSGRGLSETKGRAASAAAITGLARGTTETKGRAASTAAITPSATGHTASTGRAGSTLAMIASATGKAISAGRALSGTGVALIANGIGKATSAGRALASAAISPSARGAAMTKGNAIANAGLAAIGRGIGKTMSTGRAGASAAIAAAARGASMSKGNAIANAGLSAIGRAIGKTISTGRAGASAAIAGAARGASMTFGQALAGAGAVLVGRGIGKSQSIGRAGPIVTINVAAHGIGMTQGRSISGMITTLAARGAAMFKGLLKIAAPQLICCTSTVTQVSAVTATVQQIYSCATQETAC